MDEINRYKKVIVFFIVYYKEIKIKIDKIGDNRFMFK